MIGCVFVIALVEGVIGVIVAGVCALVTVTDECVVDCDR